KMEVMKQQAEGPSSSPDAKLRAVGYIRVSTGEQAESGAGLEAQRDAIEAAAAVRGWGLLRIYEDAASGKSMSGRKGLEAGIGSTASGEMLAGVRAVVAQLERRLIGPRAKDARRGTGSRGGRVGRWSGLAPEERARIIRMHAHGKSLSAIAAQLNLEGVPTA